MPEVAPDPPLPEPDAVTRPFWEACGRRALEVCACATCGHLFLPPGPCCPKCWSASVSARHVSELGRVESFTIYHRTYHPGKPTPYVVALVALDEGPRLVSNVVACTPEAVTVGLRVRVRFEPAGEFVLPLFEPARGEEGRA